MPGFAAKPAQGIPRTTWALGLVSLFMDLSSELVHSLLPLFLVGTLGASMLTVGLIEGLAAASAGPAVTLAVRLQANSRSDNSHAFAVSSGPCCDSSLPDERPPLDGPRTSSTQLTGQRFTEPPRRVLPLHKASTVKWQTPESGL